MALRIRKDGRILCAAIHKEKDEDIYIDDAMHYQLSVVYKILVTEDIESHKLRGEWWFLNQVPKGIKIDKFYLE